MRVSFRRSREEGIAMRRRTKYLGLGVVMIVAAVVLFGTRRGRVLQFGCRPVLT